MSSIFENKKVHRVLEDTKYAYTCNSRQIDTDYAEFASQMSLTDFRRAFGNPELTSEQLCRILRGASNKERRRQCKTPWAMFMANYLERNTNSNSRQIH